MQVAYYLKMKIDESPRRARRRIRLGELIAEVGSATQLANECGTPKSHVSAMLAGTRGLGDVMASKLELLYAKPSGWFDQPPKESQGQAKETETGNVVEITGAHSRQKNKPAELVIPQFDVEGSMGNGLVLRDQPGVIQSWVVSEEWIDKNIKSHTGAANLCIVTGFGDSMKGMFNSGDPLVIDKGIRSVDFDAVYFFRVEGEGFIKRLQRIPGEGVRVISENKKYESWTIKRDMDFEVFGRVVKAWQGEDF